MFFTQLLQLNQTTAKIGFVDFHVVRFHINSIVLSYSHQMSKCLYKFPSVCSFWVVSLGVKRRLVNGVFPCFSCSYGSSTFYCPVWKPTTNLTFKETTNLNPKLINVHFWCPSILTLIRNVVFHVNHIGRLMLQMWPCCSKITNK